MPATTDTRLLDELSQQFVRAVALTCGREAGLQAANVLEPVLGKDWKDRLILHKLSGTYQLTSCLSLRLVDEHTYRELGPRHSQKITAIKEIRAISNFGLVQAKTFVEDAEVSTQVVTLSTHGRDDNPLDWQLKMLKGIEVLRQCGFEVNYA